MARRFVAPMSAADAAAKAKALAKIQQPKEDWKSVGTGSEVMYSLWGFEALVANIAELPQAARDAAGFEMEAIAAEVIATAKDGMVPYLSGRLSSSGGSDVYEPTKDLTISDISMWFGAPNSGVASGNETFTEAEALQSGAHKVETDPSEYALIQHEDLTFNHPQGGGPKYLEIPFLEAVPTVLPRVANAIAGVMDLNPAFVSFAINPADEQ